MIRRQIDATLAADLWVFRIAAAAQNFREAGEHLSMSQSAVSQRINRLEARLGAALFLRTGRRVALTEAGRTLHESSMDGFDRIAKGLRGVDESRSTNRVRISCVPSLALEWLAPRIQDFMRLNPHIVLEVFGETHVLNRVEAAAESIDIVIRYGRPLETNLVRVFTVHETLFPVASPALAAGLKACRDVTPVTLLHDAAPWIRAEPTAEWDLWLAQQENHEPFGQVRHLFFNLAELACSTAIEGGGVAMGRGLSVSRHLAEGRLVRVGQECTVADYGVYAQFRPKEGSILRSVLHWLESEMKATAAAVAA